MEITHYISPAKTAGCSDDISSCKPCKFIALKIIDFRALELNLVSFTVTHWDPEN